MYTQLLQEKPGERRFTLIFEIDDEVHEGLTRFAKENNIKGAHFTAIGAFRELELAYWNWDTKEYETEHIREQVEVASMQGNISLAPDGEKRKVHSHVVIGMPDHSAKAGHLKRGHVRPTLEVFVTESPTRLQRVPDDETGLALLRPQD